jgi:hypothetical protein
MPNHVSTFSYGCSQCGHHWRTEGYQDPKCSLCRTSNAPYHVVAKPVKPVLLTVKDRQLLRDAVRYWMHNHVPEHSGVKAYHDMGLLRDNLDYDYVVIDPAIIGRLLDIEYRIRTGAGLGVTLPLLTSVINMLPDLPKEEDKKDTSGDKPLAPRCRETDRPSGYSGGY